MDCEKTFTINVEEGGPCAALFEDLVWGVPNISNSASGSFNGNVFSVTVSGQGPPAAVTGSIDNDGTVAYEGPEIECCLTIDVTLGPFGETYQILINHSDFGNLANSFVCGSTSCVIPFTIPETVVPATITVHIQAAAGGEDIPDASYGFTLNAEIGGC